MITALARSRGLDLRLFAERAAPIIVVRRSPEHAWSQTPQLPVLSPLLSVGVAALVAIASPGVRVLVDFLVGPVVVSALAAALHCRRRGRECAQ